MVCVSQLSYGCVKSSKDKTVNSVHILKPHMQKKVVTLMYKMVPQNTQKKAILFNKINSILYFNMDATQKQKFVLAISTKAFFMYLLLYFYTGSLSTPKILC